MTFVLRPLTSRDVDALVLHVAAHAAESGAPGDIIFMPRARGDRLDTGKLQAALFASLTTTYGEPGWLRAWGAFVGPAIIGHVDLRGRPEPSARHRASLGIGVLRPHRGRGVGAALLRAAVEWARAERSLAWLDLGVFAHNEAALRLYRRFGFCEVGRVVDLLRIDGHSIDDISMTLRLS